MALKPSKTTDQAAVQITRANLYWGKDEGSDLGAATTVTYGYRASINLNTYESDPVSLEGETFSRFTALQITQTELAIKLYEDVGRLDFQRVNSTGYTNNATMLFANYKSDQDGAGGFAMQPPDRAIASSDGDFWYNLLGEGPGVQPTLQPNTYSFWVLIHELGHAVGLDHPGEYNAEEGVELNYNNSAEYKQDSLQYSIESYFEAENTGAYHIQNGETVYPRTLLLHDIAAVQRLYGANMEARTTDTIYGFNSNAGTIYKLDSNAEKAVLCIWDAAGRDTLDFSGYTAVQTITLMAEAFSSVGGLKWNWSIAKGVTIENAKGGSGADVMIGNAVANTLEGNGGNDLLRGGFGVDSLVGGLGSDTADFTGLAAMVSVVLNSAATVTAMVSNVAGDTLTGIENVIGGGGNDSLFGDGRVNTISGGAGMDIIRGGTGLDTLDGGLGAGDRVESTSPLDTFVELRGAAATEVYAGANWDANDRADIIKNFESASTGRGNDELYGDASSNILRSNGGNDFLAGRGGKDVLAGGIGTDTFIFGGDKVYADNAPQLGLTEIGVNALADVVEDFTVGSDKFQLDHDTFTAFTRAANTIVARLFNSGVTLETRQKDDVLFYDTDDGLLYYDKDGSNAGSVNYLFADLAAGLELTSASFEII